MTKLTADLGDLVETLKAASHDPNSVSIGAFADAIQGLQAELRLLEGEVNRLADVVDTTQQDGDRMIADTAEFHKIPDQADATKA